MPAHTVTCRTTKNIGNQKITRLNAIVFMITRYPLNLTLQCGPSEVASSQICGRQKPARMDWTFVQLELLKPVLARIRRVISYPFALSPIHQPTCSQTMATCHRMDFFLSASLRGMLCSLVRMGSFRHHRQLRPHAFRATIFSLFENLPSHFRA